MLFVGLEITTFPPPVKCGSLDFMPVPGRPPFPAFVILYLRLIVVPFSTYHHVMCVCVQAPRRFAVPILASPETAYFALDLDPVQSRRFTG